MMKSCLISILVSLVSLTASWGQAKGTQVTETDSTVTLQNSKVRVEFLKGETFDISKQRKRINIEQRIQYSSLDPYL